MRGIAGACIAVAVLLLTSPAVAGSRNSSAEISTKRTAILAYLTNLPQQNKTLSGVQVNEFEVYIDCTSADRLKVLSGKRPAVLGLELMNVFAVPPYERYLLDRAEVQTAAGGLVTMSWHQRNPIEICARGEHFECSQKLMSAADLKLVLTPGTREHQLWVSDVRAMARTLHKLRDKGIVVLFRPYHEMNGGWFWWGKQSAFPELWDALYDELVVREKLDNLIWVFSVDRNAPDADRYFPKRHMPDLVGTDMYEADPATWKFAASRKVLSQLAGGMPFAVSEVGLAPTKKVLDEVQPAYVLLWGDMLNAEWANNPADCSSCNKPGQVAEFMRLPQVISLDDLPGSFKATVSAKMERAQPLHAQNPRCPIRLR